MWIEVSVVIAVIIFAVLAGFIIRTLLTVQRSLQVVQKQVELLSPEVLLLLRGTQLRVQNLDPLLRSLSNIGTIVEDKSSQLKRHFAAERELGESHENVAQNFVEWALLSATLCQKFLKRR